MRDDCVGGIEALSILFHKAASASVDADLCDEADVCIAACAILTAYLERIVAPTDRRLIGSTMIAAMNDCLSADDYLH